MDLIAIALLTLLMQPLVYGPSIEPVRVALGLLLVLFSPGYVLVSALFPRKEQLSGVERVALGLGLSLALVPLIGLVLNFTPWGIRLTPILGTLSIWTLAVAAVAWLQRRKVGESERFEIPLSPILAWFRMPRNTGDRVTSALLVVAVLAVVGTLFWKIQQPTPGESFSEFYVLGAEGMLQDYPTNLRVGVAQNYNVGVISHEKETTTYVVRAFLGDSQVGEVSPLVLEDGETWEDEFLVVPLADAEGQKLEFRLYKDPSELAYRTIHLFVDVRDP